MVILFSATLLLSATLVFFIQPVVGKLLIPYLGGTPAVWNTCLVFFQGMLLLGYLYAHVLGKYFSRRIQLVFHLGMMFFVLLLFPMDFQKYIVMEKFFHEPIIWILRLLIIVVGLPFLIVTATAPLLQKWFSYANKDFGRDPYFLYSASNFGSLLALVSYPLIFEMFCTLATQQVLWRAGYWLLFFAVGVCGLFMIKGRQKDLAHDLVTEINENIDNKPGPLQKKQIISWVLLAALPSSLLYGITDYLSTHVAAVPLFWVIPLIL